MKILACQYAINFENLSRKSYVAGPLGKGEGMDRVGKFRTVLSIIVGVSVQEELIMYILRKLDIRSLCRLAHTCKLLQAHTSDPILYMTLNLQVCYQYCWIFLNFTLFI